MNLNSLFFKYFVYYPITMLRGEFPLFNLIKLRRSQYIDENKIKEIQLIKLKKLIKHAAQNTLHYKNIDASTINSLQDLQKIPLLDKDSIRNNFDDFTVKNTFAFTNKKTTGGSTGAPVSILKDNFGMAQEFAATWRGYEWAGISMGDKQARFWGVPLQKKAKRKAKLIDFVTNRFRLSAFSFSDKDLQRYVDQLELFKPIYFYGYVSMIKEFAIYVSTHQLASKFKLRCIITTSEVLSEQDRKLISDTFNCPVFNEYGCGEIGTIAHECEHGRLHLSAENIIVEIVDGNGAPVTNGDVGEIVATDLTNFSMPLIRYKMKDFAAIDTEKCPCGRGLPILKNIQGRAYDLIKNKEGKIFHGEYFLYHIEDLKKSDIIVNGYQVEQLSLEEIVFRLVCTQDAFVKAQDYLSSHIQKEFPNTQLTFIKAQEIIRESSGKLRVIKGLKI